MRVLKNIKYISTPSKFLLFLYTFWVVFKVYLLLRFVNLFDIPRHLSIPDNKKTKFYNLDELARFINFISGKIFHSKNTCLIRSLVLFYFYQRMKLKKKINIGVRKQGQILSIHAWLEGSPSDSYNNTFEILYTFPDGSKS